MKGEKKVGDEEGTTKQTCLNEIQVWKLINEINR